MASSRFPRVVLRVVLALVALVLLGYVGLRVADDRAAHDRRDELSAQLTQRLAEEVPPLRATMDEVAGRVGEQPAHLWVVQECRIESTQGGLLVQDYRQRCQLVSAAAWPAADLTTARDAVAGVTDLRRLRRSESDGCQVVAHGPSGTASYVAPGWDGATPWCLEGLETPDFFPYRTVAGQTGDPDPDRGWLVLHGDERLLDESVGCSHLSVLSCSNRFGDEPAWGDAPA